MVGAITAIDTCGTATGSLTVIYTGACGSGEFEVFGEDWAVNDELTVTTVLVKGNSSATIVGAGIDSASAISIVTIGYEPGIYLSDVFGDVDILGKDYDLGEVGYVVEGALSVDDVASDGDVACVGVDGGFRLSGSGVVATSETVVALVDAFEAICNAGNSSASGREAAVGRHVGVGIGERLFGPDGFAGAA